MSFSLSSFLLCAVGFRITLPAIMLTLPKFLLVVLPKTFAWVGIFRSALPLANGFLSDSSVPWMIKNIDYYTIRYKKQNGWYWAYLLNPISILNLFDVEDCNITELLMSLKNMPTMPLKASSKPNIHNYSKNVCSIVSIIFN